MRRGPVILAEVLLGARFAILRPLARLRLGLGNVFRSRPVLELGEHSARCRTIDGWRTGDLGVAYTRQPRVVSFRLLVRRFDHLDLGKGYVRAPFRGRLAVFRRGLGMGGRDLALKRGFFSSNKSTPVSRCRKQKETDTSAALNLKCLVLSLHLACRSVRNLITAVTRYGAKCERFNK